MDKIINAQAFEAYLQKAFKLTAEDIAGLYNEAGELTDFAFIETKDAERVKKFGKSITDQYGAGFKKGAASIEDAIREKYAVDSDLIGVELFDHIVETKVSEIKSAKPEEVLKHPEVIKALNEKDKLLKLKDKEIIDKLKAKEDEINMANLFKEVETNALAEFDNLKPILPADAKKAANQKAILISELKRNKYQKDGSGFIVLKEDGNPLQDQHGNNISFQDHIKSNAERYFDFKAAEDRSASGNKENGQPNSQKVRKPKDETEYVAMMKDQTLTPKERVEIMELHTKK